MTTEQKLNTAYNNIRQEIKERLWRSLSYSERQQLNEALDKLDQLNTAYQVLIKELKPEIPVEIPEPKKVEYQN